MPFAFGTPNPRPTTTLDGGPADASVTVIVPAVVIANACEAVPNGPTMLENVSLPEDAVGVAGVVVVSLLPHPEPSTATAMTSAAAPTSLMDTYVWTMRTT